MFAAAAALMLCLDPVPEIARGAGHVGAAAAVLEAKTLLEFHAGDRFPMQSVYKLPIGMAALAQMDRGLLKPDQRVHVSPADFVPAGLHSPLRDAHPQGAGVTIRELARLAVSESDGSASDLLLRLIGGASAVMQFLDSIGIHDIAVRDSEMSMSRDWSIQYANYAAPRAAIELLRALEESRGLSAPSRDLLLKFMTETPTSATRIKALLPAGVAVAHKTGSSGVRDGVAAATNDIGIITLPDGRHLAIAVFVSDSRMDEAGRDRVIARIAEWAYQQAQR